MTVEGTLTEVVLARAMGSTLEHARTTLAALAADDFALVPKVLVELVQELATIDAEDDEQAEAVLERIETKVAAALVEMQRRVAEATAP